MLSKNHCCPRCRFFFESNEKERKKQCAGVLVVEKRERTSGRCFRRLQRRNEDDAAVDASPVAKNSKRDGRSSSRTKDPSRETAEAEPRKAKVFAIILDASDHTCVSYKYASRTAISVRENVLSTKQRRKSPLGEIAGRWTGRRRRRFVPILLRSGQSTDG